MHDEAFALLVAAQMLLSTLDPNAPLFSEPLIQRVRRVNVRVEVFSMAVMMAMAGERKARSVKLLEGLISELFRAVLRRCSCAQELVSIASMPRDLARQTVPVTEIRVPGRRFALREGAAIDIEPQVDGVTVYMHAISLNAAAAKEPEARAAFDELFASQWDDFGSDEVNESRLAPGTLALRVRMRELVSCVEHVA